MSSCVVIDHHFIDSLQEHSREAPFFCVVVQSLQTELKNELRDLETIHGCIDDFKNLKMEVEPWLKHKPETSTLLGIRKSIRSLKSKLRHKMADIEDIEEVRPSDSWTIFCHSDLFILYCDVFILSAF